MTERNNTTPLILPCLRGAIGDWVYYVVVMPLSQIAARIKVGEEIYGARPLQDMLQRALTKRAPQIADYLVDTKQRFFSALVAAVHEGEPEWYQIELGGNPNVGTGSVPESFKETLGVLSLSGEEKIFALDGQHRLEGIRKAVLTRPSLGKEELTVVFVGHKETKKGKERTRRLFSTLNRYAKPVTLGEIIILDEDDAVAITTRRMVTDHPLLSRKDFIATGKTKTIPRQNTKSLTSIQALYESLVIVLFPGTRAGQRERKLTKRLRPNDQKLDDFNRQAVAFWDVLISRVEALRTYSQDTTSEQPALPYRGANGGHLIFRPIGLLAVARTVRRGLDLGIELETIVTKLSRVPFELSAPPWAGLLWNPNSHVMIVRKENQRTATLLLQYMIGFSAEQIGLSPDQLRERYANLLNRPAAEVRLPDRIDAR